jgi:hypothetical protein
MATIAPLDAGLSEEVSLPVPMAGQSADQATYAQRLRMRADLTQEWPSEASSVQVSRGDEVLAVLDAGKPPRLELEGPNATPDR